MGHPPEIGEGRIAEEILADRDRELGGLGTEGFRFENLAKVDELAFRVGNLDPNDGLSGKRRDDAHRESP